MKRNFYILLLFIISFIFSSCLSFSQTGHWELLHPKTNPGERYFHDMAPIGHHKVLLFGGYSVPTNILHNDTWIFDLDSGEWDSIPCKNPPLPRENFSMSRISEKKVLLFGGTTGSEIYSDLWEFDLDSLDWKQIETKNNVAPSYYHNMARLNDNEILVFGGETIGSNYIRLYVISDSMWYSMPTNLKRRSGFLMTEITDNLIFLCCGHGNNFLTDHWFCNEVNYTIYWDSLESFGNQNISIINGDMQHLMNGLVMTFGGTYFLDDTFFTGYSERTMISYIYGDRKWKILNISYHPDGRYMSCLSSIDSNKILMFGGSVDGTIPYSRNDETWLFVLDSVSTSVDESFFEQNKIKIHQISENELEIIYNTNHDFKSKIMIYDIRGNLQFIESLENQITGQNRKVIDISRLSTGVYSIIIQNGIDFYRDKFVVIK
jgi:hypothetical protein